MKLASITGIGLLLCLGWPAPYMTAQTGRVQSYREGEAYRAAGQDSLAQLAYLRSTLDDAGRRIPDSLTGRALQEVATIYLNQMRDRLALPYFRRSLALRDSLFTGPHNERAHVRTNMAMSIYWLGMEDAALQLTQEANAMYETLRHPDSTNWLINLNELGLQAINREDYGLAYSSSFRAVELVNALPAVEPTTRFVTFYRAARVLSHFGDCETALRLARQALVALPTGYIAYHAACLNLIALLERETQDFSASKSHLEQSLAVARQQPAATLNERADAALYLAEHYAMAGDPHRRETYERLAVEGYTQAGSLAPLYRRNELSRLDFRDGRYLDAARRLDAALEYLHRKDGADVSTQLIQLSRTLLLRARLQHALRNTEQALTDLHEAFEIQERLRSDFTDPASRRYLSQDMRAYLDLGVQLHYVQHRTTGSREALWQAFRLSERARAFSLVADLGRRSVPEDQSRIQQDVARLEREIAWGDTSQRGKLEALRIRLAGLERRSGLSGRFAPALDSATLVNYLAGERTQLLEYHLTDSLNLAFLLTPDGDLQAFELPLTETLTHDVVTWNETIRRSAYRRKSLRPRAEQGRLDSGFLAQGYLLADRLIPPPARNALRPGLALCIVPDGVLNNLPFAALPLRKPAAGTIDYRDLSYLLTEYAVSYAYSGSYLAELARLPEREYRLDLLALAPGFGAKERTTPSRSAGRGVPLAPLVFNQDEAREIAALLPNSEVYCDSQATRERFLAGLGASRILHLSTHGMADPGHPELSFVAFHQPPGRLDPEQLLYYNDLVSLSLDNDLTVLSACETSLGRLATGEAPLSLATALAAAGARSTLTTLWQVDDRATRNLMVGFYRELQRGSPRRDALAAAQNSLRAGDYFHPFYWAAPTLYGLPGSVPTRSLPVTADLWGRWSGIAAACLALAILFTHYLRRN